MRRCGLGVEGKRPFALEGNGVGEHYQCGGIDLIEEFRDTVAGLFCDPPVDGLEGGRIAEVDVFGLRGVVLLEDLLEGWLYRESLLEPEGICHGELHGGCLADLVDQRAIGGVERVDVLPINVQSFEDGVAGGSLRPVRGHGKSDGDAGWRDEEVGVAVSGGEFTQQIEAELRIGRREGALCVGGIAAGKCGG